MNKQDKAVSDLVASDFQVVQRHGDIIRLTKGADDKLVSKDRTTKRAQHVIRKEVK